MLLFILLDSRLLVSTLLCRLVTGIILTYAIVIMPGLSRLDYRAFKRAFQVTGGIIQNRQMVFTLISLGSIFLVVCTMGIAFVILNGSIR